MSSHRLKGAEAPLTQDRPYGTANNSIFYKSVENNGAGGWSRTDTSVRKPILHPTMAFATFAFAFGIGALMGWDIIFTVGFRQLP